MESDNGFNLGRSSEIKRDELKFNKFTNRLQKKFSRVFVDVLRTQLILKEIVTQQEFDSLVRDFVQFDYASDNHFAELKDAEIMRERLETLGTVDEYVGKYYSQAYVRKNILMMSEEEIKLMDKQIADEGDSEDGYDIEEF